MIYTGIVLYLDLLTEERSLVTRGLYKVLLIEPKGTKIVHGIPLSVFGSHSGNFIRYSTVIYRPGDRVFLLQLNEENSKYYLILGSQGNIFMPDYNFNRISIYDSITSQGIIINEPELTALNFASALYFKNDTIHKIMSEIYLTTDPQIQSTELKHIDLLKGNIGAISLYSNIDGNQVLEALKSYYLMEENESVSFELKTPKDLVKTHILDCCINTRPESRILNYPYSFYRTGENIQQSNSDRHILHSYNIPYFNTSVKFVTDKGYLAENINLYFDEYDIADKLFTTKDQYVISRKYHTARKVIYQKSYKNTKDSANIIENYRKINYNAWLHLNEPYIQDSKVKTFKSDSFKEKRIVRLDTENYAREVTESYFIDQTSKNEYIRNIADIEIINKNQKTKIKDSTSIVQSSKFIILRYDKYKHTSFKRITYKNILQKVLNKEQNSNTVIDQKDDKIVINVVSGSMQTTIEIKPNEVNINVNNKTRVIANESEVKVKVDNATEINIDNSKVDITVSNAVNINGNLNVTGVITSASVKTKSLSSYSGGSSPLIVNGSLKITDNLESASITTGPITCSSCSCCSQ